MSTIPQSTTASSKLPWWPIALVLLVGYPIVMFIGTYASLFFYRLVGGDGSIETAVTFTCLAAGIWVLFAGLLSLKCRPVPWWAGLAVFVLWGIADVMTVSKYIELPIPHIAIVGGLAWLIIAGRRTWRNWLKVSGTAVVFTAAALSIIVSTTAVILLEISPQVSGLFYGDHVRDTDGDGIGDAEDNCPNSEGYSPGGSDEDHDGIADVCHPDFNTKNNSSGADIHFINP